MSVRWSILLILLARPPSSAAQQAFPDAVGMALSGAGVARSLPAARPVNPAAPRHAVAIGETRLFMLPELRRVHVGVSAATREWTGSTSLAHMGFEGYRGSWIELNLLRAGPARVGASVVMQRERIMDGNSHVKALAGAGLQVALSDRWRVGAAAEPARRLQSGVGFKPSEDSNLYADVSLVPGYPHSFHVAGEWRPVAALTARGGWSTHPERAGLGIELRAGSIRLAFGANRHDALGWSWALDLSVAR